MMRLARWSGMLIEEAARKLRRRAVAGSVIAVCALGFIAEGLSAARLALEPTAGPVGARLVLSGIFLLVAATTAGLLLRAERRAMRARAAACAARTGEDPRGTLIVEAVVLGYGLGRDFMRASANGRAAGASAATASEPGSPGCETQPRAARRARPRGGDTF